MPGGCDFPLDQVLRDGREIIVGALTVFFERGFVPPRPEL